MPLNPFSFTPPQGFRDSTFAPTDPPSETAFRDTMQDIPDQLKDELNSLYLKLNSTVDGSSGADVISATPLIGGTANTVQGILEELKTEIDSDDSGNVKLTGNQTINGEKTFALSPQVPTPDSNNDTANKGYVDSTVAGVILGQISDGSLTDAKLSDSAGQIKDRVNTLEFETDYNNKAIAEMQMFLELESKIPSKDNNKLYTDFINSFIASSGVIDLTSQNYTGTLSSGATSVVVTSSTGFVQGQEISIQDAVGYEDVIISSVVGNTINFKTALINTYTNPRIYRSNNDQTGFGTSGATISTYDRTTPVQVVNATYDTSGNGGRKLVILSNGWLISVVKTSTPSIIFYKSTDDGATWSQLCFANVTVGNFSISSNLGTKIVCIFDNTSLSVSSIVFDATTVTNTNQSISGLVDINQSAFSGCSLTVDTNGHLHATWSSKNATYPNSFNIRYSKSTDGGATWATPTQITAINTSGQDYANPSIVVGTDNKPHILVEHDAGTTFFVKSFDFTTVWTENSVYSGSTYTQSNPSATLDSNGVIHVAWHGVDATDTTASNIRYSKSTNGGATWSTPVKITSGNTLAQSDVSITTDKNNNPHLMWRGYVGAKTRIRHIAWNGSAFGSITDVTTNTVGNMAYPSTCDNYKDFEKPLTIWQDFENTRVAFYGKWTETFYNSVTKNVVRMNVNPYINCSEIQAWLTKSELAGFTVDGKASFKALSADDENYIDLVETITDLGSTNEVSMTGVSAIPSKYITLKLILQRASASDAVTFTKLVGGVA